MLGREFVAIVGLGLLVSSGCASPGSAGAPSARGEDPRASLQRDAGADPSTPVRGAYTQGEGLEGLLASGGDESSWAAVPAGASEVLSATVADGGVLLKTRVHAVEGLAWVQDARAADVLRAVIADGSMVPSVRSAAITSLARRLGRGGVPELQALLSVPEPNLRAAAARSLAVVGGADAQAALEARLESEESPELREVIQMSLTQMQP